MNATKQKYNWILLFDESINKSFKQEHGREIYTIGNYTIAISVHIQYRNMKKKVLKDKLNYMQYIQLCLWRLYACWWSKVDTCPGCTQSTATLYAPAASARHATHTSLFPFCVRTISCPASNVQGEGWSSGRIGAVALASISARDRRRRTLGAGAYNVKLGVPWPTRGRGADWFSWLESLPCRQGASRRWPRPFQGGRRRV